jgi:hypothetical protein
MAKSKRCLAAACVSNSTPANSLTSRWGQLAGRNRDDKSNRHAGLRIGQEIAVEVVSVDRSTRNPNIQAREVYDASAQTSTPRRTGRVLTARAS